MLTWICKLWHLYILRWYLMIYRYIAKIGLKLNTLILSILINNFLRNPLSIPYFNHYLIRPLICMEFFRNFSSIKIWDKFFNRQFSLPYGGTFIYIILLFLQWTNILWSFNIIIINQRSLIIIHAYLIAIKFLLILFRNPYSTLIQLNKMV